MNAIKFIQDNGVDKAREVVEGAPDCSSAFNIVSGVIVYYQLCDNWWWFNSATKEYEMDYSKSMKFELSDLKRLVESVDLIGKYHSIDHAKNHYNNMREALNQYQYENKDIEDLSNELKQAIADYEAIYSDNDMGDDSHIENHVSPLCKVGLK